MCQVKLNLLVSLRLLTEVIFPSLISSIPVLAIMLLISSMYHYETPLPGSRVDINIHASMTEIDFAPKELFIFDGQNTHFIVPDQPSEINILYKGRVVYKGNPLDPPTKRISKKVWWNTIIGSEVGYVRPGTPVEEIAFNYPRRRLLSNVPFWLSTWELPFFAFLTIAAVILKFAFHIK